MSAERTVFACPRCDCARIWRSNGDPRGDAPATSWKCRCGASFDDPDRRGPKQAGPKHTRSAHANALIDADPDEVGR